MAEIAIKGVAKRFGGFTALHQVDSPSPTRNSWCCSALRLRQDHAAADCSRGWKRRARARSGSVAAASTICRRATAIAMVFQNYASSTLTCREHRFAAHEEAAAARGRAPRHRTAELMHIEQLLKRYSGSFPAASASA